jgi:probable rRNA maturation factor
VSDATIRSLNRRFHHQDCVTDCLAFGYGKSKRSSVEGGPLHLGDVVISLDRTRVHARKWKQRFQHELWRYVIHGILHLVGYRDNTARNRGRMEKRQESILKKAIREVG